jgi:hypothetical protein
LEHNAAEGVREPLAPSELGHCDQANQAADRHDHDSDPRDDVDTYDSSANVDVDASGTYVLAELRIDGYPVTNDHDRTAYDDDGCAYDDDGSANNDHHGSGARSQHGVPDRNA